jgi:hypothetical protein
VRHETITNLVKERASLKMEIAEIKATTVSVFQNNSNADINKLSPVEKKSYSSVISRLNEIERQLTIYMR